MVSYELKKKVLAQMAKERENFAGSDAKFAVKLGISSSQYSRIKNGETERIVSDENWITIARQLGVTLRDNTEWKTANTPVWQFITTQLEKCQAEGLSSLLCDLSDIGKSYVAVQYSKSHKNVVYIDCSQVKSKQMMVRRIAREFGVGSFGRYTDVYEDLCFYIKTLENPLIILDEAGDLKYDAFLEIKALWNATEKACGWYMMGVDLEEKMRRAINCKKVGYTEIFSRFGKWYIKVIPIGGEERKNFMLNQAAMIIKANRPDANVGMIIKKTLGDDGLPSLRRIYKEISKLNQ